MQNAFAWVADDEVFRNVTRFHLYARSQFALKLSPLAHLDGTALNAILTWKLRLTRELIVFDLSTLSLKRYLSDRRDKKFIESIVTNSTHVQLVRYVPEIVSVR